MAALKVVELRDALAEFASVLEANTADKVAVRSLREFGVVLGDHEDLTVLAFVKSIGRLRGLPNTSSGPSIANLRDVLTSFQPILVKLKRKDLSKCLDSLLVALRGLPNSSVVALVAAVRGQLVPASASEDAAQMNSSIVDDYVRRLENALGDDRKFGALFDELSADGRVDQSGAVAIATIFYGHTSARTPRSKALGRVRERHLKLMKFKRQPSTAGRSAA
jgi:hypothetical protein